MRDDRRVNLSHITYMDIYLFWGVLSVFHPVRFLRQLYPSVQGDIYRPVIDDIQDLLNEQMKSSNGEKWVPYFSTLVINQIVLRIRTQKL